MGKGFTRTKETVKNFCVDCGEPCISIKVARTAWARKQGIETGMMWKCENGHINRERRYKVEKVRL